MWYVPAIITIQQSSGDLARAAEMAAANPWAATQAMGLIALVGVATGTATWHALGWWIDR